MLKTSLKEIMTTEVVIVTPNTTMDEVEELFEKYNFHHLPVIGNGKLIGILSKSDYLMICDKMTLFNKRFEESINARFFKSLLVEEVMCNYLAKAKPNDTVEFALSLFKENIFHALPIIDEEDRLLGIVTTYDLLNFAFSQPPAYMMSN